jgi:hypothetical protein
VAQDWLTGLAKMVLTEVAQEVDPLQKHPKTCDSALQGYIEKLREQSPQKLIHLSKDAFPQEGFEELLKGNPLWSLKEYEACEELVRDLGLQNLACETQRNESQLKKAEDSDGEEINLCHQCHLPLGEKSYRRDRRFFHGECMAQLMVHDMKDEHTSRQQKMRQEKRSKREEYGIGWDACCIPRNENPATKLAMRQVPEGLVCLVADEEAKSIRVASTTEPAKAVNLEYLSIALQVRRLEGHEPIFSLDPTDATDTNSMQQKVFVPEWLAGTSVGEVLFQADYHLKELSMESTINLLLG